MHLIVKYMIYLIIISGGLSATKCKPVIQIANIEIHEAEYKHQLNTNSADDATRPQRQVVQPKWLTDKPSLFVDPNVHVTKESLTEAAVIRDQIQAAVDNGQFVVSEESESPAEPQSSSFDAPESIEESASPLPPFLPQWSFVFPQFQPSADMPNFGQFMTQPQQQVLPQKLSNKAMEEWNAEWRRRWLEFVEKSRKMFRWN